MIDVDPHSRGNTFRARRVKALLRLARDYLRVQDSCAVLDVGGTPGFWHTWRHEVDFDKIKVTCVNLDTTWGAVEGFGAVAVEQGDATDLRAYPDRSFDIAFSNSVIHHVGTWVQMEKFAREIRRVARSYFVQTPYFWFPVEPHAQVPFLHWLPVSLALRIVMARRCGYWPRASNVSEGMALLEGAKLLDALQFAALFPDAAVSFERFIGLPKSLIALRHDESL